MVRLNRKGRRIVGTTFLSFHLVVNSMLSQGAIRLSNISSGQILVNGVPAKNGEAKVQFALTDGTLVGHSVPILGSGYFSGGSVTLDGILGEVTLKLAVFLGENPYPSAYSETFTVLLIDPRRTPPLASIPSDFKGVNVTSNEPAWTERKIKMNAGNPARLYRGMGLHLMCRENDVLVVKVIGKLETADHPNGPWLRVSPE